MAQTAVMPADTTALTSAPIVVAEGAILTLALYTSDADGIPPNEGILILLDTPSQDQLLAALTPDKPAASIAGPVEIILKRAAGGVAKGVVRYT